MDTETELIIKGLNISKDRYTYIISYIEQVIKDYKGHPVYIIEEIPLNLKGNERYFTMFMAGSLLSPTFYDMNDIEKTNLVENLSYALNFGKETLSIIADYMEDIRKEMRENVPTVEVLKKIIHSNFTDIEKDYILFIFGLVLV